MFGITVVGRCVNPKSTDKSMNFAVEGSKPMSKEKQLITVQLFFHPGAKVQEYIKQNTMLSVVGQLELGEYKGKRTVRVVANTRNVQLLDTRTKEEKDKAKAATPPASAPEEPAAATPPPEEEKVADEVISDHPDDSSISDEEPVWGDDKK